jgi:hypothetical protein
VSQTSDNLRREVRQARSTLNATRKAVRLSLETHPRAAVLAGQARRAARVVTFRVRSRLADRGSGDPYLDSDRVFYVPTAALRRRTALPYGYDPSRRPGAVVAGDWDQPEGPTIIDSPYWTEFREALEGRHPWPETAAFRAAMRPATAETSAWRRRILTADAQRVIKGYELLYESMRTTGCLSQRELAKRRGRGYRPTNTDDISIAVGRAGELLLCQGGHRVETARTLGIEAVPVWVGVRHADWWALRRRIVAYAVAHGGRVPEPLLHPDLDNTPFACDCGTRFDLVAGVLSAADGLLVDVCPGWGYFLHRFEGLGFDCAGVAADADDRYFLERLRAAGDGRFAIADTAESLCVEAPVAAVLLLRGSRALLRTDAGRTALASLFSKTRPLAVFVEGDPQSASTEADSPEPADQMVRFCAAATLLTHVALLGHADGNPIYHLSGRRESDGTPA